MSVEQALLSFTLAAGLLTITPGLDTALVLRTAAVEGTKASNARRDRHMFRLFGLGSCGFFRANCTPRRFRFRLQRAADRWRCLSGLFGNQVGYSRIHIHFFKQCCHDSLAGRSWPRQFSVAEARLVDKSSQSQGRRLLPELPTAIYPHRRSGLVIQHSAGVDSCDRRTPVVLVANKRD